MSAQDVKQTVKNNEVKEMATFGDVLQSPIYQERLDELVSLDFELYVNVSNSTLTVKHLVEDSNLVYTFNNPSEFQEWLDHTPFVNRLTILRRLENRFTNIDHLPLKETLHEVIGRGVTAFRTKLADFAKIENDLQNLNSPLPKEFTIEIEALLLMFKPWGKDLDSTFKAVDMIEIEPKENIHVDADAIVNLMGKVGPLGADVYASPLNDMLLFGGKREQLVNDLRVCILDLCPVFLESSSASELLRFYNSYNRLVRLLCTNSSPLVIDIKKDFVILASFTFDSVYYRLLSEIALLILKLEAAE